MLQIKAILKRLKNPSVLISIISQVLTILTLLNVSVDINIISGTVTAVCSILVLLGIVSDPNTKNKGYGEDFMKCQQCNKICEHVMVKGNMVCKECGYANNILTGNHKILP